MEEKRDGGHDIRRETYVLKQAEDRIMGARVKGFFEVVEEEVVRVTLLEGLVKILVEVVEMILHRPTRDETLLIIVNDVRKGVNNKPVEDGSNNPVVSVRDYNRARILNRTQAFFRDKVKKPTVEVGGGVTPESMS